MEKTLRLNIHEIARLQSLAGIRSQAELARRSGWSLQHLSAILGQARAGKTPSVTLRKLQGLCQALNVDFTAIVETVATEPAESSPAVLP